MYNFTVNLKLIHLKNNDYTKSFKSHSNFIFIFQNIHDQKHRSYFIIRSSQSFSVKPKGKCSVFASAVLQALINYCLYHLKTKNTNTQENHMHY